MKQTFKVYHEQVAEIELDIPEGISLEEQREMIEEAYYHGGKQISCEDIPEITDIENEEGLSLIMENPFLNVLDMATDTLAQVQTEMDNLVNALKEKLSDKELHQILAKAHISRNSINRMLNQEDEMER